jgi:hypothetical protein
MTTTENHMGSNVKDWMDSPDQKYSICGWKDGSIGEWTARVGEPIPEEHEVRSLELTYDEAQDWLCGAWYQ